MRQRLVLLGCLLAICALLGGQVEVITPQPTHAAEAAPGSRQIEVSDCYIRMIDRSVLATDRSGIVAEIMADEGARVEADQQLVQLHDEIAKAAFDAAAHAAGNDVQVRFASMSSRVAKVELEKAEQTNRQARGAVTAVELLRLDLQARRSILEIEQAEHEFKGAKFARDEADAVLATHRIHAPFEGIVTHVYKSAGEAVTQGDPIIEIANPDRLRVEGFVELKDHWALKPNSHVKVQLQFPDNVEVDAEPPVLEGRLAFIDVSVQPVSKTVRVWAEVINRDNLFRAGLEAKMTIDPSRIVEPAKTASRKSRAD